jgi:Zn-dependent protease with chaperone function
LRDGFGLGVTFAFLEAEDYNLQTDANLRRCQSDTPGRSHGVEHVLNQGIKCRIIIEVYDGAGDLQQSRIPHAERFNPRAKAWQWEVNLIGSKQINAFCMPGGKIAFYTGILDQLKLTDDEVAMIMGHEIAHALWEHARERMAKSVATDVGASLLGELVGGGKYSGLFRMGGDLLTLKFSRSDESEADLVGLDLAARAGYDPRAGITLWQKMAAASKGGQLEFLSTHPSGSSRIEDIKAQLPKVMPLYESARS